MPGQRINAPENGMVVRGVYYPGGKMLPKEGRQAFEAASPGGGNTFIPGGVSERKKGMNPDQVDANYKSREAPSGQGFDQDDERDYKVPRTVTITHPDRNLKKVKYIDPHSKHDEPVDKYEAIYSSSRSLE